jgi:hypothetical protein
MSDKHYEAMANIKIPEQMRQAALDAAGPNCQGLPVAGDRGGRGRSTRPLLPIRVSDAPEEGVRDDR